MQLIYIALSTKIFPNYDLSNNYLVCSKPTFCRVLVVLDGMTHRPALLREDQGRSIFNMR